MKISALLTSAGINIGLCVLLLSLYSILRKQPGNAHVYFGRRFAQEHIKHRRSFNFERLVPSPSWIVQAWGYTEDDILQVAGLDAVVFIRTLVFSIRIFSIATVICVFGVLPVNYFGQEMRHHHFSSESMDVFTIGNVKEGSRWLWVHCLALYIISCSACTLLYFEYKSITRMRIAYITGSPPNPSHFTVLVRAIPRSTNESFSGSVKSFFTKYHASSYLAHQIIFRTGKVQTIMNNAEKVYKRFAHSANFEQDCRPCTIRCGLCGGTSDSFHLYRNEFELVEQKPGANNLDSSTEKKECPAAFVFFKTRYAAFVASQVLQSSNPMLWVTDLAPEPHDVYWSNLWIPYRQLWLRHTGTLLATIIFMFLFLIPVAGVQGLTKLDELQKRFPFLGGILKKTFVSELVTGYLPSVVLLLFQLTVPPTMMLFSALEGPISRSGRKKSACCKVLYFTIWNIFFGNILSGTAIDQLNAVIPSPKDIPNELAKALSKQATFFITYVLTSGWTSLSFEVMQHFSLIWSFIKRFVFRSEVDPNSVPSFPYHTEVPRVLLFGLLGFTCSVLAPLILPFLLVYFFLGYIVYRNQILNVYSSRYETGGQLWPIAHNTTIFSLVLAQIIALGVFGIKQSPVAAGFTIPLVIGTLFFNEYCRQRFRPIFKIFSAQDLIDMDKRDEESERMEEIHQQLHSAYCQFSPKTTDLCKGESSTSGESGECSPKVTTSSGHPTLGGLPIPGLQKVITALAMLMTIQDKRPSK